jgi:hypothetical protein
MAQHQASLLPGRLLFFPVKDQFLRAFFADVGLLAEHFFV